MAVTHFLVTDATAAEVTAKTGLPARNTPLGAFVEKPKPDKWREHLAIIDRALHPTRCTCGYGALMHRPGCPEYLVMT